MANSASVNVKFDIPHDDVPKFSNIALVSAVPETIVINFAYIDPNLPASTSRETADEPLHVSTKPIARVVVTPSAASQLIKQLQDALEAVSQPQEMGAVDQDQEATND